MAKNVPKLTSSVPEVCRSASNLTNYSRVPKRLLFDYRCGSLFDQGRWLV
jgi:hypothetical protein